MFGIEPNQLPKDTPAQIINPIDIASGVERVKQLQSENALAPIRAQQAQTTLDNSQTLAASNAIKLQQQQKEQQDDQIIQAQLANPDTPTWKEARPKVMGKVNHDSLQKWDTDYATGVKTAAETQDTLRKQSLAAAEEIAKRLYVIKSIPPGLARQDEYTKQLNQAVADGLVPAGKLPDTVPDDARLDAMIAGTNFHKEIVKAGQEQAESAAKVELAKKTAAQTSEYVKQGQRSDAAARHLLVTNQAGHTEFLQNLPPEIQDEYAAAPIYNSASKQAIQDMALTPNQRATTEDKRARAATQAKRVATMNPSALAAGAFDPDLPPEQRNAYRQAVELQQRTKGMTNNAIAIQARDNERQAAKLTDLQNQEIDLHTRRLLLGKRITKAAADGQDTIKDPKTGKDLSIADAQIEIEQAQTKVNTLNAAQEEIQKNHGWGSKYRAGVPEEQPSTSSPANAPPANVLKEGKATRFANGQIWTLQNGVPMQLQQPQ